jgi:hypothetical protein
MKKSEELRIQAAQEESDFKSLSLHSKALREEKKENFKDKWLPLLLERTNVTFDDKTGKYTFFHKRLGMIDFFPKANRILIRRENKWYGRGLHWIITNYNLK